MVSEAETVSGIVEERVTQGLIHVSQLTVTPNPVNASLLSVCGCTTPVLNTGTGTIVWP